jgi:hypothetical protein
MIRTAKALIEKRLAQSLEDIREGRVHGPFRSAAALLRSLHRAKKRKRPRCSFPTQSVSAGANRRVTQALILNSGCLPIRLLEGWGF